MSYNEKCFVELTEKPNTKMWTSVIFCDHFVSLNFEVVKSCCQIFLKTYHFVHMSICVSVCVYVCMCVVNIANCIDMQTQTDKSWDKERETNDDRDILIQQKNTDWRIGKLMNGWSHSHPPTSTHIHPHPPTPTHPYTHTHTHKQTNKS